MVLYCHMSEVAFGTQDVMAAPPPRWREEPLMDDGLINKRAKTEVSAEDDHMQEIKVQHDDYGGSADEFGDTEEHQQQSEDRAASSSSSSNQIDGSQQIGVQNASWLGEQDARWTGVQDAGLQSNAEKWGAKDEKWGCEDEEWGAKDEKWGANDEKWGAKDEKWGAKDEKWSATDLQWHAQDYWHESKATDWNVKGELQDSWQRDSWQRDTWQRDKPPWARSKAEINNHIQNQCSSGRGEYVEGGFRANSESRGASYQQLI